MGNIYTEATVIRKGDASTRYTQYTEKSFNRVKMEPIHNILTYCKTFGSVTINNSCGNTSTIVFENDGTLSNLPTWERTKQIAENAGVDGAVVADKAKTSKKGTGFDAYAMEWKDMMEAGIIDPAKVTRTALQNAASIASLLLTTECAITDIPEKNPAPTMPAGDMGGMGGMY